MKIVLFHPLNSENTGDKIILIGSQNILKKAFGEVEFIYQDLRDADCRDEVEYQRHEGDLLVVSGTPWFWETCARSVKYRELSKVISLYSGIKKVGLGLGACYPLTTSIIDNYIQPDMEAVEKGNGDWRFDDILMIRETFGTFDLVLTRDSIAQKLLDVAGVESYETVCPAAFVETKANKTKSGKSLMIFQDPGASISNQSCDAYFRKQFIDFETALMYQYNMDIATASEPDSNYLIEHHLWNRSSWIESPGTMLSLLNQYKVVVSCRVHEAIPARVFGALTYILPMDSRFLTACKIGVLPLFPYGYSKELVEIGNRDMKKIDAFTYETVSRGEKFIVDKLQTVMS